MREFNFRAYRPTKKPKLTPAMLKKRLAWGKKYQRWTVKDWRKVCESFINLALKIYPKDIIFML